MKYRNSSTQSGQATLGLSTITAVMFAILLVAIAAIGAYFWQQHIVDARDAKIRSLTSQLSTAQGMVAGLTTQYSSPKGVLVSVYTPAHGGAVPSPLIVLGQVPGSWSFEASFPIELKDQEGHVIASGAAHLLGDWVTDELVPFSATLTYANDSAPNGGTGTLVLHKDNPSGLVKNDDEVRVPIRFVALKGL